MSQTSSSYDVVIIGGSFAGLTAALQLGRASRRALVLDTGQPRNRFSPGAHGVPGWDGVPPGQILDRFRQDLNTYETVELRTGAVTAISGQEDDFLVRVDGNAPLQCRRIILSHGMADSLPDIPGLTENWGQSVLHCPYCHGYEVKTRPLAILATHPMSAHQAHMLRSDWSDDVTLLVNGAEGVETEGLEAAGIKVEHRRLRVAAATEDGLALSLDGGAQLSVAALFLAPAARITGTWAQGLGCQLADGPMGAFVQVGQFKQTSVPGVFAAGDLASPMPKVNFAIADGTAAGIGAHQSMVFPGFIEPLQTTAAS